MPFWFEDGALRSAKNAKKDEPIPRYQPYLRKSAFICGLFVFPSRPFAVPLCIFAALREILAFIHALLS
jgi:hypothetical protein